LEREKRRTIRAHLLSPLAKSLRHKLVRLLPVSRIAVNDIVRYRDVDIPGDMHIANLHTVCRRLARTALEYWRYQAERLVDDVVDVRYSFDFLVVPRRVAFGHGGVH
jgi:hypothetical protein